MLVKSYIERSFSAESLSQVMGLSLEKVIQLTNEKILVQDAAGKYNLPESNKAYIKHRIAEMRKQVHSAGVDLTVEKIGWIKARRMQAELVLAKAREEVIEVDLVQKQAAFLFVAMRQKLLAMPGSIARKLLHQTEMKQVVNILTEAIHKALKELREFPTAVIDPNWKGDEEEESK